MTQLRHLRRLVRSRLGVPQGDQLFPDDQLDDHINLAIETVEAEQRWPWHEHVEQVTIDQDNPDIELGSNWRATRSLHLDTGEELALVSPTDVLSWYVSQSDVTGLPQVWAPVGNAVLVRPLPNGPVTLTHFFYTQPTWLRGDDAVPAIPDQFDGAIVAKAAELLSVREDDRAAAITHLTDYERWIDRMRRDVRRSTTPVRVRVRPGGWLE